MSIAAVVSEALGVTLCYVYTLLSLIFWKLPYADVALLFRDDTWAAVQVSFLLCALSSNLYAHIYDFNVFLF